MTNLVDPATRRNQTGVLSLRGTGREWLLIDSGSAESIEQ
jgi:hypothetical protein